MIRLTALARDRRGVSAVEFGLLTPALFAMLFGLLDLGHTMYTAQMLHGAIQQAARDSTLEGASGQAAVLDGAVIQAVRAVAPGAQVRFARKAYSNFSDAARPEDYTDVNANGRCDAGEPFEDSNANGSWDTDRGQDGFGGARAALLYTVTVNYQRFFPVHIFIPGQTETVSLTASTVLRNQPYTADTGLAQPIAGTCP